ncbi:hypothetical protein [Oceanibaculum nanhaiense]|uniref:hypothetical protein n=1 Tax=Oceanibaculum nanhaiense TaxID=1909734 RepID=UPI00111FC162|nr:hypothetical protein [Oceanibaculum nanhaiense]
MPRILPILMCLLALAGCASKPEDQPVRYEMKPCLAALRAALPEARDVRFDPSELTHRGGDWTVLAEAVSPDGSFRRAWRCDFRDGVFLSAAWLDKAE